MAESNLLGQQVQGYQISKKLGSGGYGTVYLGVKEDLGKQYQTAIKHISMPDADAYESVLQDYSYDKAAVQAHFEKMVSGITSEINTLLELSKKDNRYIVAYYDHDIQKSIEPLRFEIFMRMEYLTPLNRAIRQKGMTLGEVIKLGLNMCEALALCHNNDVMHRDIKEANIFVSENGNYKLGDFGVAKVALETTQAGSIKGTASYMAPEIYLREPYDKSVDIYSLGIVLYKLLNNQRLPFMPDAPAVFTADDKNNAETKRLKGETPPLPFNAKNRLGEIIVKACSVKAERYATAEELKKDLTALAASSMGILVSSLFKNADRAMTVAPLLLMPQLLFSGLIFELEGVSKAISVFAVCRWSMESYGTTSNLNTLDAITKEGLRITREQEVFFDFTKTHISFTWLMLCFYIFVFSILAGFVLRNINNEQ